MTYELTQNTTINQLRVLGWVFFKQMLYDSSVMVYTFQSTVRHIHFDICFIYLFIFLEIQAYSRIFNSSESLNSATQSVHLKSRKYTGKNANFATFIRSVAKSFYDIYAPIYSWYHSENFSLILTVITLILSHYC